MEKIELKKVAGGALALLKKNVVFVVALIAAAVSCIFVPFDEVYPGYFDWKTIVSLFCMLLVVCALRNIKFFRILARKIVTVFRTARTAITALIVITYVSSMLIANDMALITFLPLGAIVLKTTKNEKYTIFTFIMMTIAANLGGMLTPFGNPQNLFLYNYFNIPTAEFFEIMWPPFVVSAVLIAACCFFVKREPLIFENDLPDKLNLFRTALYAVFFVYAILIVFRVVPFWTGLLMIPIFLFVDRKALLQVDYVLLGTFLLFFIFAGNLARIESVSAFFSSLMEKSTLLTGVLSTQVISNVPSAVLLSGFTDNYPALLAAVNIGGCGTLISSLASLITFRTYAGLHPGKSGKFLLVFHAVNFSFLIILTIFCYFIY